MAESLFPFFGDIQTDTDTDTLPIYREVSWDFANNIPIVERGNFVITTGIAAIKTWAFKAMKTERFRYRIYSWDFGCEMENLIGESFTPNLTKAECVRYIKEALLIHPYITAVSEVSVSFSAGKLSIAAKLETVYGETEVRARV